MCQDCGEEPLEFRAIGGSLASGHGGEFRAGGPGRGGDEDGFVHVPGPEDDGGAPVPVFERAAGIAGIAFGVLLEGFPGVDRQPGDERLHAEGDGSARQRAVLCIPPVGGPEGFLVDLAHLFFVPGIVRVDLTVAGRAMAVRVVVFFKGALQFAEPVEADEGEGSSETGGVCGSEERAGTGSVVAFEVPEREVGLGVLVIEEDDCGAYGSGPWHGLESRDEEVCVFSERPVQCGRVALCQDEIVNETAAYPVSDLLDFMFAVGEEGGALESAQAVALAEIDGDFLAAVAHKEPSAFMRGRQGDDERSEHGGEFFGVAVRQEVAALLIDQELVEFGGDLAIDAEVCGGFVDGALEIALPFRGAQGELGGIDLAAFPDTIIPHRAQALAVRCRFACAGEFADLRRT